MAQSHHGHCQENIILEWILQSVETHIKLKEIDFVATRLTARCHRCRKSQHRDIGRANTGILEGPTPGYWKANARPLESHRQAIGKPTPGYWKSHCRMQDFHLSSWMCKSVAVVQVVGNHSHEMLATFMLHPASNDDSSESVMVFPHARSACVIVLSHLHNCWLHAAKSDQLHSVGHMQSRNPWAWLRWNLVFLNLPAYVSATVIGHVHSQQGLCRGAALFVSLLHLRTVQQKETHDLH